MTIQYSVILEDNKGKRDNRKHLQASKKGCKIKQNSIV